MLCYGIGCIEADGFLMWKHWLGWIRKTGATDGHEWLTFLVLGSWFLVLGSCFLLLASCFLALGSRFLVLGSWLKSLGQKWPI